MKNKFAALKRGLTDLLVAMALVLTVGLGVEIFAAQSKAFVATLNLDGYADASGAIAIQHQGNTLDPYFVLQALLLAHEHGLDIRPYARPWADWLIARQKPDATFDRFCHTGGVWAPCKIADADDSLLALWLKFLNILPAEKNTPLQWENSRRVSKAALAKLFDPTRGIYLVSPVYQHGLFMDNLEVWSYKPANNQGQAVSEPDLRRAIQKVFWDVEHQRFLVSTQAEQRNTQHAFYPDAVAQIFPLLMKYPYLPGGNKKYYQHWMKEHRSAWLKQVEDDFAWGLIAIVALQQNDLESARCWLQKTLAYRRTWHWTLTDEVVLQILQNKGLTPIDKSHPC